MADNLGRTIHEMLAGASPRRYSPPPPAPVQVPFDPLPPISEPRKEALQREAFRVNDRYVRDFIEEYSFCPYARRGRRLGQIRRYFYYADSADITPLVGRMRAIAADPKQIVAQVILPLVEVEARAWRRFVGELTAFANHGLPSADRIVTAALHPALPWSELNEFALIPLFRRAPDPTIQWVRQAPLDGLYRGRGGGTGFVAPGDIEAFLKRPPPARPLYDRIAATNATMARRLRLETVEKILADHREDARRSYEKVLFDPCYDGPGEGHRIEGDRGEGDRGEGDRGEGNEGTEHDDGRESMRSNGR